MVCIVLSMRRFFRADHPKRWWYAALGGSVLVFLVVLAVVDVASISSVSSVSRVLRLAALPADRVAHARPARRVGDPGGVAVGRRVDAVRVEEVALAGRCRAASRRCAGGCSARRAPLAARDRCCPPTRAAARASPADRPRRGSSARSCPSAPHRGRACGDLRAPVSCRCVAYSARSVAGSSRRHRLVPRGVRSRGRRRRAGACRSCGRRRRRRSRRG